MHAYFFIFFLERKKMYRDKIGLNTPFIGFSFIK